MPSPRQNSFLILILGWSDAALVRRASVAFAATVLACACTISNAEPEMFGPIEEGADAGRMMRDAESRAAAPMPAANDPRANDAATSGTPSGSGGMSGQGTAGASGTGTPPRDAGAVGSAGTGSAPAAAADASAPDAGPTPDADAALADPITCAFDLAGCFLDPFMYEACLRKYTQRCGDPFAADGGVSIVSPACAMQTADCIARNPEKSQECLAMQDRCSL